MASSNSNDVERSNETIISSGCRRVCGPARHPDQDEGEGRHPGNHSLARHPETPLLEAETEASREQAHAQGD